VTRTKNDRMQYALAAAPLMAAVLFGASLSVQAYEEEKTAVKAAPRAAAAKAAARPEANAQKEAGTKKMAAKNLAAEKAAAEKATEKKTAEDPEAVAKRLRSALRGRTDIVVDKVPLKKLLKDLADEREITIKLDEPALKGAGIDPEKPMTLSLKNFTLHAGLKAAAKELGLQVVIDEATLVITTAEAAQEIQARQPIPAEGEAAAPARAARRMVDVQGGAMNANAQALKQQQEQFQIQLRPFVNSELHFANKVCDLTAEQKVQVKEDGQKALVEAARKYADMQMRANAGVFRGTTQNDPRKMIRERIAASIKAHCTSGQVERYQIEMEQRQSDHRAAAVKNLVLQLDQELALSSEQREKIALALTENWQDAWAVNPQYLMAGMEYFPPIPDKVIVEHFSPAQKTRWRDWPKQNAQNVQVFLGGLGFMGMQPAVLEDDPFGDEPAANKQPENLPLPLKEAPPEETP
jgi:hypothetical protein